MNTVADEHLVIDKHTLAYARMRRNFAACADDGIVLDFDEGPDAAAVANATAVQVRQFRVKYYHVAAEDYIIRNRHLGLTFPSMRLPAIERLG